MYKSPSELLVELITQENCIICNVVGKSLCNNCFYSQVLEPDFRCYICNKLTKQGRVCKSCKSSSRLRHVWWLGDYKDSLKQLTLSVKYQRKRSTARLLGECLSEAVPYLPHETLVVPLPTATSRVRRRGYDQAEVIAQSFARKRGLNYQISLIRKDQKELIGKKRLDRLKLMSESFRIKPNINLTGKTVLLIDDVLTTGASLESAARLLRQFGATHVDGAVIVRRLLN